MDGDLSRDEYDGEGCTPGVKGPTGTLPYHRSSPPVTSNPAVLARFSTAWLRRRVRASEAVFILLAVGIGGVSALLSIVQGGIARTLQHVLFALPPSSRLSEAPSLSTLSLLVLPAGGVILALFSLAVRVRKRRLVDPVEANALHGGRMSVADSLVICGQTVLSNGFGASVGLEAAYTQLGGAIAAWTGSVLALRRADLRNLVGAGAGAAIGGALLIPIALVSPQALSAGHGALHADLAIGASLGFIATVLLAKSAASVVSLGFGFRGGLFFASLFLGTLIGHLFASVVTILVGHQVVDPHNAALVGMAALAVSVVGGPMTMAMLVLQATHDFALTGAVIAASLVASTIVRESFGYSFSTWRLHLRGETIKSARDVGWVKTLTAGRMMRRESRATPDTLPIAEFRP